MTSAPADTFAGPGPDKVFQDHLREGRLMLQRCRQSGGFIFYPRVLEPGSGRADLEWAPASGDGVVHATTVVRQRPEKGGDYNVALIELAEGPRMMSRVVGLAPEAVRIGMTVKARIDEIDGTPAVLFEPAR
jgi:uncharacterized OB-fold protein